MKPPHRYGGLPPGVLSTPTQTERAKFVDPNREAGDQFHRGAEIERPAMDLELNGNSIWMEVSEFQNELLPKPPTHLMPSPEAMASLKKAFNAMIKRNSKAAVKRKMKKEDVLAHEFVSFLSTSLFTVPATFAHMCTVRQQSSIRISWAPMRGDRSPLPVPHSTPAPSLAQSLVQCGQVHLA